MFSDIIRSVAGLAGLDVDDIDRPFSRFVVQMWNHRIRLWWDAAPWPETVHYIEAVVDGRQFTQPIQGDVVEVYKRDPRTDPAALQVDYTHTDNGLFFDQAQDTVWLKIKKPAPRIEAKELRLINNNAVGRPGGSFDYSQEILGQYKAEVYRLDEGVQQLPLYDLPQNIYKPPAKSINYTVRSIYADYLRSTNATEQAGAEEANAEGILSVDLDSFWNRKGQVPHTRLVR